MLKKNPTLGSLWAFLHAAAGLGGETLFVVEYESIKALPSYYMPSRVLVVDPSVRPPPTLYGLLEVIAYLASNILHTVGIVGLLASSTELPKVNLCKGKENEGNTLSSYLGCPSSLP